MTYTEITHTAGSNSAISVADALLAHREGGEPIRSIVGHDRTPPSVSSPSGVPTTTDPFDAMLHRDAIHICEADPRIVGFSAETRRFEIRTAAGEFVYRPDLVLLTSFGEITLVGIEKADPCEGLVYGDHLDRARAIYESHGWNFVIWDRAEIHQEPRLSNARAISWDRWTTVSAADRIALSRAIQDGGGVVDFGEAVAILGNNGNPDCGSGRARLHALIAQKFVEIDIARPLTLFSNVRMAQPSELSLVDILDHLHPFANQVDPLSGGGALPVAPVFGNGPARGRSLYIDARRVELPNEGTRPFLVAAMDTATRQVVSTAICTDAVRGAAHAVGMAMKTNPKAFSDVPIECDFCDPAALRAALAQVAPDAAVVLRGTAPRVRAWAERLLAEVSMDVESER